MADTGRQEVATGNLHASLTVFSGSFLRAVLRWNKSYVRQLAMIFFIYQRLQTHIMVAPALAVSAAGVAVIA